MAGILDDSWTFHSSARIHHGFVAQVVLQRV